MSVCAQRLVEELQIFDVECEAALTEKLVELCLLYGQNEEGMVAELIAFCTRTGKVGLTPDILNSFEHECLSKKSSRAPRDGGHAGARDIVSIQELIEVEKEEESLLDSYTTPSKGSQKRAITTPETPLTKRTVSTRSPHQLLSPSSFSPSATPSQKYSSRNNRGEVVTSFGSAQGVSWSGRGGAGNLSLKVLGGPESLTRSYKSMFQKLPDIRDVLTCKIEELGSELKEHYKIEAFAPVLVPAQVVIMEGINTTGRKFIATKLYEGLPLPFYQPTEEDGDFEQNMVLVACGPYTTSDSITYDPLLDLIAVINRDLPDVCILLGPFLDAKHEQVESCLLTSPFEDIFKQCLRTIIEGTRRSELRLLDRASPARVPRGKNSGSRLVFVPSVRDVHREPVYPQPPFSYSDLLRDDRKRVQFVSEPCSLAVNGVILGLTSTDLLFHMGAEEISSTSGPSDRLSRILKHILTQRSYYPLYPPQEDMAIDYENFYTYAQLPVTPDVFIIPSELKYFVKDVLGCICVNPGRLTKGQVGGTFGRLFLRRRRAAGGEGRQSPCVAAQVVRI
ncbi:DNA polymerase alpha subunit B isoform X3 [Mustela lutreola]|uniref:DNA polymerase alpha subunit B isoform X3 n=1 Tax=Mustela lutreola TaxID=9666 RepID=UPI002797177C|nr:DNA polymerase alpha subunit B isoform X3 [Mustela lutreola]